MARSRRYACSCSNPPDERVGGGLDGGRTSIMASLGPAIEWPDASEQAVESLRRAFYQGPGGGQTRVALAVIDAIRQRAETQKDDVAKLVSDARRYLAAGSADDGRVPHVPLLLVMVWGDEKVMVRGDRRLYQPRSGRHASRIARLLR